MISITNISILLPILVPTGIFYLIGIYLVIFILKTKLFSLQENYTENTYILNIGFKILLMLFSLLLGGAYFGLITINSFNKPIIQLLINILLSIALGLIVFIILFKTIIFLMNHRRNIDSKGIKTKLLIFSFIIMISFNLYTSQLANASQSTTYELSDVTASHTNSKNSIIAYIESYYLGGSTLHNFLVIKNLNTKNSTKYDLCEANSLCLNSLIHSVQFYNNSVVILNAATSYGNTFSNYNYYYFNFFTKDLGELNQLSSFYDPLLKINSSLFSYQTSTKTSKINSSQYELYINMQDILTQIYYTIVLDNYTGETSPNFTIAPDFSKLAIVIGPNIYFYKIINFKAILVQKLQLNTLLFSPSSVIRFIQWENSSILYYSLTYTVITQLDSFNYMNGSTRLIHTFDQVNNGIIGLAINNSFVVSEYPILAQSLTNTNVQLSTNTFYNVIIDSSGTHPIVWNNKEIVLMSFDQSTHSFKQTKVIDRAVTSNDLSLLGAIESVYFIIAMLLAIAIIVISHKEELWQISY